MQIARVLFENHSVVHPFTPCRPTDAAVDTFLKQMGLTMTSLAARPQLAKHLIRQHLVLALPPDAQQALVDGKLTSIPTAATTDGTDQGVLRVVMSSRGASGGQEQRQLRITDGQGQTSAAVKVVRQDSNKIGTIIDKVVMSSKYCGCSGVSTPCSAAIATFSQ
jgi:hypothetical protein